MSVESVTPSSNLILCCPLLLLSSVFPRIRVFSSELALGSSHQVTKVLSFSVSPSNEYSGLISFRFDRFDFLAVQGTLKSLLQHHSLKASSFWCSVFFKVRLSHLYMTTGKTVALTLRAKSCLCFLICCLGLSQLSCQGASVFMAAEILEPKKVVCHCFYFISIYLPWSTGTGCHDLRFLYLCGRFYRNHWGSVSLLDDECLIRVILSRACHVAEPYGWQHVEVPCWRHLNGGGLVIKEQSLQQWRTFL